MENIMQSPEAAEEQRIREGNTIIAKWLGWKVVSEPWEYGVGLKFYCPLYPNNWIMLRHTDYRSEGRKDRDGSIIGNLEAQKEKTTKELWEHLTNPRWGEAGRFHLKWEDLMPVINRLWEGPLSIGPVYEAAFSIREGDVGLAETLKRNMLRGDKMKCWECVIELIKLDNKRKTY